MCTAILIEHAKVPKKAIEDMVVYKVGSNGGKSNFISPYQRAIYNPNKLARAAMRFTHHAGFADNIEHEHVLNNGGYEAFAYVKQGFHSFNSIKRAKDHIHYDVSFSIGKFIIPKGSKYYENGCGNIVSNQIIFKEFV